MSNKLDTTDQNQNIDNVDLGIDTATPSYDTFMAKVNELTEGGTRKRSGRNECGNSLPRSGDQVEYDALSAYLADWDDLNIKFNDALAELTGKSKELGAEIMNAKVHGKRGKEITDAEQIRDELHKKYSAVRDTFRTLDAPPAFMLSGIKREHKGLGEKLGQPNVAYTNAKTEPIAPDRESAPTGPDPDNAATVTGAPQREHFSVVGDIDSEETGKSSEPKTDLDLGDIKFEINLTRDIVGLGTEATRNAVMAVIEKIMARFAKQPEVAQITGPVATPEETEPEVIEVEVEITEETEPEVVEEEDIIPITLPPLRGLASIALDTAKNGARRVGAVIAAAVKDIFETFFPENERDVLDPAMAEAGDDDSDVMDPAILSDTNAEVNQGAGENEQAEAQVEANTVNSQAEAQTQTTTEPIAQAEQPGSLDGIFRIGNAIKAIPTPVKLGFAAGLFLQYSALRFGLRFISEEAKAIFDGVNEIGKATGRTIGRPFARTGSSLASGVSTGAKWGWNYFNQPNYEITGGNIVTRSYQRFIRNPFKWAINKTAKASLATVGTLGVGSYGFGKGVAGSMYYDLVGFKEAKTDENAEVAPKLTLISPETIAKACHGFLEDKDVLEIMKQKNIDDALNMASTFLAAKEIDPEEFFKVKGLFQADEEMAEDHYESGALGIGSAWWRTTKSLAYAPVEAAKFGPYSLILGKSKDAKAKEKLKSQGTGLSGKVKGAAAAGGGLLASAWAVVTGIKFLDGKGLLTTLSETEFNKAYEAAKAKHPDAGKLRMTWETIMHLNPKQLEKIIDGMVDVSNIENGFTHLLSLIVVGARNTFWDAPEEEENVEIRYDHLGKRIMEMSEAQLNQFIKKFDLTDLVTQYSIIDPDIDFDRLDFANPREKRAVQREVMNFFGFRNRPIYTGLIMKIADLAEKLTSAEDSQRKAVLMQLLVPLFTFLRGRQNYDALFGQEQERAA